jgi:hypothetical protein
MNIRKKILQTAGVGALLVMTAGVAQAALVNGSFEDPDASAGDIGGAGTGWGSFNNTFVSSNNFQPGGGFVNPAAHSGTQVLKQFGGDAGATQSIAASAGDLVEASVYAISYTGDPFNNLALLQIAYFDAGGGFLSVDEIFADTLGNQAYDLSVPQDGDPASDWTLMEVAGIAPTGTASAQILLLHILTDGTPAGGSIFWDDANLTASAVPVPAAVWLFGSGLLGLVGVARRRKS